MGEFFHGRIFVGGKVSKASFKKLVNKFFDEGFEDRTYGIAEGGGVLIQGDDYQAHSGQFEGFEDWLIKHKVSFLRESEGLDGDWKPEVRVFDPESGKDYVQITNEDHNPIIDYGDFRNFVKELAGKSIEDMPRIAAQGPEGSWLHQFACEVLTGSTELAAFIDRKLADLELPDPPSLTVEGMSDEEVLQALNDKLDES